MRNVLKLLAVAGLVAITGGAASAQSVNVRIGVGDQHRADRVERHVVRDRIHPVASRRIVERRRIVRQVPRTRTVCRTVVRSRVVRAGVIVRKPTRVCTTRTRY
jgi:hypothetical protein